MSISEHLKKIKSEGDFALWAAIVLSLLLGVGFGQLWSLSGSRSAVNIIEPQIIQQTVQNNKATVIQSSQESVKTVGKSVGKPANEQAGRYVASKNSDKYHLPTCPGALRIKEENKIWFNDKAEAEAAGLTPAANCPGI